MSDPIKHECGIAAVRLLKPLEYYTQKYGSPLWGFNKLFLLMEKQHNRGQDGVGIGCAKLNTKAGMPYMFRDREHRRNPLGRMFERQLKDYNKKVRQGTILPEISSTVKEHFDFGGEVMIGHLRYGTSGSYGIESLHPYVRRSNWPTRSLMLAGNFNITNLDELNKIMIERGQHPIFGTDTQTILEKVGYALDEEHQRLYHELKDGGMAGQDISEEISKVLDPASIISGTASDWDGGYTVTGLIGNGDLFVMRDPHGIRPCSYIQTDEYIAFASERVALMTAFDAEQEDVKELDAAEIAVIKNDGSITVSSFAEKEERKSCSFERIYFSRGNDPDIYSERKALGAALCDQICNEIDNDLGNTVLSYIPNTAETAFYGLLSGLRIRRRHEVKQAILDAQASGELNEETLDELIMGNWPRSEKVALKDIKMRTFITQDNDREQLVSHVYDITYGLVKPTDNLLCLDDSIVRGTTLRESILKMLSRTNPKKIIIASTAPQIRYPDCYGIDMSELGRFIAFEAAVALINESGKKNLLRDIYQACIDQNDKPAHEMRNEVARIYEPFTDEQISKKIAELLYPKNTDWNGELVIIYQTIDDLHKSCPGHSGDWYFTGNYPTAGGRAVLNRAFINYYENKKGRGY